eukprot:XP_011661886.1 PREDICTED: uncharacterized protein LOC105437229 [Strongylocentrotus purpuratus]
MAASSLEIMNRIHKLQSEILSNTDKLVICVIDQHKHVPDILHDLKLAVYGDAGAYTREKYLTDAISLIIDHERVTLSGLKGTAAKVQCMVFLVNPAFVSTEASYIKTAEKLFGRVSLCAMLDVIDVGLMSKARKELEKLGITDIYEVPTSTRNDSIPLSEKKKLQWLLLLRGCLQ